MSDEAAGAIGEYADRVLDVVEQIPSGRVMSYGDIAEYLGSGGPRQVGRVMATYGGSVAWWRVIHADGTPAPGQDLSALQHYREEGTPLRSARPPVRVDMRKARWQGQLPAQPVSQRSGAPTVPDHQRLLHDGGPPPPGDDGPLTFWQLVVNRRWCSGPGPIPNPSCWC
jgi:alkylated DNA nucleotide flippase Atl1